MCTYFLRRVWLRIIGLRGVERTFRAMRIRPAWLFSFHASIIKCLTEGKDRCGITPQADHLKMQVFALRNPDEVAFAE